MRLDIAAQTDIGRRKQRNEDFCGVYREDTPGLRLFSEGALLCVADGLGGHGGGDVASKLAVSVFKDILKEEAPQFNDPESPEAQAGPLLLMRNYIKKANDTVFKTNQDLVLQGPESRPMGTTLLTALIEPRKAWIGTVGDSRAYHIREGEIIAMTEDHSWVDEQVKLGLMSKAEALTDRRKNIVTRCVGTHEEITVDTYLWHIVPGDMVLLCSDGLVNMATDQEILAEFRKNGTAAEIAQRLVTLANENGGKDNITVIVANVSPSIFRLLFLRLRSIIRRGRITPALVSAFVTWGLFCFFAGYLACKVFPIL
jgi:serine/threonine protein phosphatase PrpC